jgi:uncharacterized protein (TIGR00297 family)
MAALGAFFIGSSLISRLAPDRSVTLLDAKGSTRDSWQVLANGGAAALAAILPVPPRAALWMVTASLAAAAADTWATSTGGWSKTDPRHILLWTPVPSGTSGGVTLLGTGGALFGATIVGAATAIAGDQPSLLPLAVVVGTLGMLTDSVLGSVWQGRFHCPVCDGSTERRVHRCGAKTSRTGGAAWLTNDGVNAIATLFAAALGYLAFIVFAATSS